MEYDKRKWRDTCLALLASDGWVHARENHRSDLSDSILIDRVARFNVSSASRFVDDNFDDLIFETLTDEETGYYLDIIDWFNDESDNEVFIVWKKFDRVIGKGFCSRKWHEWNDGPASCDEIEVILEKVINRYGDTSIGIKTAYPLITEAAHLKWDKR